MTGTVSSGSSQFNCCVQGVVPLSPIAKHIDQHHSHPDSVWPSAGALQSQVEAVLVPKLMVIVSATESYSATAFWMDMRSQLSGSLGMPLWAGEEGRRRAIPVSVFCWMS